MWRSLQAILLSHTRSSLMVGGFQAKRFRTRQRCADPLREELTQWYSSVLHQRGSLAWIIEKLEEVLDVQASLNTTIDNLQPRAFLKDRPPTPPTTRSGLQGQAVDLIILCSSGTRTAMDLRAAKWNTMVEAKVVATTAASTIPVFQVRPWT